MTTIEQELRRYRICRANIESRGGDVGDDCLNCQFFVRPRIFRRFAEIEAML